MASILIVDDEPESQELVRARFRGKANVSVVHPNDVDASDIKKSQLVLIDLALEHWRERDALPSISLRPLDGLALAGVLRVHAEDILSGRSVAFALHSGKLDKIAGVYPARSREHVVARAHNLEWVFDKAINRAQFVRQAVSLASAVEALPPRWPWDSPQRSDRVVRELLGISGDADWAQRAWSDVEGCHPPVHDQSEHSHGMAFVRWLLHRILPYPCFLFDAYYLAARLRLPLRVAERELRQGGRLNKRFARVKYRGILGEFLGDRWWRAGIEEELWQMTEGDSMSQAALATEWRRSLGFKGPKGPANPVVCIGADMRPAEIADADNAVRVQPDDWPAYAEQPWATTSLVEDEKAVRAIVLQQEREQARAGRGR